MAASIYPQELPNRVRNDPLRSAEARLYDNLAVQLSRDWTTVYGAAWLGPLRPGGEPQDGEVDFVVAHPSQGVLLIEVKGGAIRYDSEHRTWISRDRKGVDHSIDPFDQVRRNKYALIEKVRSHPGWRDRWVEMFHAVAFPDVERPRTELAPDAPPEIIIGKDDLSNLPHRLEEIFDYWHGQQDRPLEDGDRLVRVAVDVLGRSIELRNPLRLQIREEEEEFVRLTQDQFRTLDILSRVRRAAMGGCAGSGKTFLAVEKAKRLATSGNRTLLTCYNRPLAAFLSERCEGVDRLEVMTFHRLCKKAADEAGVHLPEIDDESAPSVFREEMPEALLQAMEALPALRYDAIVVDEGQDFEDTWWIALERSLVDSDYGILYIFYDTNQILYRDRGQLPSGLVEVPLSENLRNTRSIFQFVSCYYRGGDSPEARGPVGRTPEVLSYSDAPGMRRQVSRVLSRLIGIEGLDNSDIIVLTPRALEGSALLAGQLDGHLQLVPDSLTSNRQIQVSTVHRFKGLERPVVILTELEQLSGRESDALMYVAVSRPRSHLIVIARAELVDQLAGVGIGT